MGSHREITGHKYDRNIQGLHPQKNRSCKYNESPSQEIDAGSDHNHENRINAVFYAQIPTENR